MDSRRMGPRIVSVPFSTQKQNRRNFLIESKSKVLHGLKIVLNLPFKKKLVLFLVSGSLFIATLFFAEIIAPMNISAAEYNDFSQGQPVHTTGTAVLYLQRPQRPFHGNHWYHIGEYYISRHEIIEKLLTSQSIKLNSDIKHLKLVVQDSRLSKVMTKMSFAFIVQACRKHLYNAGENLESVELFAPQSSDFLSEDAFLIDIADANIGSTLTMIERRAPLLGYYKSSEGPARFVYFGSSTSGIDPAERASVIPGGQEEVEFKSVDPSRSILTWYSTFQFLPTFKSDAVIKSSGYDVVYLGAVGAAPIPPVEWFHSSVQADLFRSSALSMCNIPQSGEELSNVVDFKRRRVYKLVVYQRDLNRRFVHLKKVIQALKETHKPSTEGIMWDIEVVRHRENADPCGLYKTLHSADILLTAHGFQSTALMFMKKGSVILEVFPFKYHRTTYMPLSRVFGLHYRSIQNTSPSLHSRSSAFANLVSTVSSFTPSTQLLRVISQGACMRDLKCRSYARSRDISMPPSHIEFVAQTMTEVETQSLDPYFLIMN